MGTTLFTIKTFVRDFLDVSKLVLQRIFIENVLKLV